MKYLVLLSIWIERANVSIGKQVSWLTLFMVIITAAVVILRYGFNVGFIWMQELVRFMYAAVFLLCAAYTLASNEHVRVDIFYIKMQTKYKSLVDLVGSIFFLIPVCCSILFFSYKYIINSWLQLEGSLEERGLHAVYILKTFIWLFALMLAMQSISIIIKSLTQLKCKKGK